MCTPLAIVSRDLSATDVTPSVLFERKLLNASLRKAAQRNDFKRLTELIAEGADIHSTSYDGYTALIYAARGCHSRMVRYLLKNGSELNAKTSSGKTALIFAVRSVCAPVVRILLRYPNIEVFHRDNSGKQALDYAISATALEVDGPSFQILRMLRAVISRSKTKKSDNREQMLSCGSLPLNTGKIEIG